MKTHKEFTREELVKELSSLKHTRRQTVLISALLNSEERVFHLPYFEVLYKKVSNISYRLSVTRNTGRLILVDCFGNAEHLSHVLKPSLHSPAVVIKVGDKLSVTIGDGSLFGSVTVGREVITRHIQSLPDSALKSLIATEFAKLPQTTFTIPTVEQVMEDGPDVATGIYYHLALSSGDDDLVLVDGAVELPLSIALSSPHPIATESMIIIGDKHINLNPIGWEAFDKPNTVKGELELFIDTLKRLNELPGVNTMMVVNSVKVSDKPDLSKVMRDLKLSTRDNVSIVKDLRNVEGVSILFDKGIHLVIPDRPLGLMYIVASDGSAVRVRTLVGDVDKDIPELNDLLLNRVADLLSSVK